MKPKTGKTRWLARVRGCPSMWARTARERARIARAVKRGLKAAQVRTALAES